MIFGKIWIMMDTMDTHPADLPLFAALEAAGWRLQVGTCDPNSGKYYNDVIDFRAGRHWPDVRASHPTVKGLAILFYRHGDKDRALYGVNILTPRQGIGSSYLHADGVDAASGSVNDLMAMVNRNLDNYLRKPLQLKLDAIDRVMAAFA